MPLNTRDVTVDYLPQEGIVNLDQRYKEKDTDIAQKAQNNLALKNVSIYAPGLDADYLHQTNREITYSFALANIYRSINTINDKIHIRPSDDEATQKYKQMEKDLFGMLAKKLENIYPEVLKTEYPDSGLKFENGRVSANMKGEPTAELKDEALKEKISKYLGNLTQITEAIKKDSPTFQASSMRFLDEYTSKINDKLTGKKVITEEKTDEEIIDVVKKNIAILIRDDSNSPESYKIDRERAVNTLAQKLAPLGMDLEVVPIEDKSPQEETLSQAKTCILRAAWDGFIERPKQYNCSKTLQNILLHPQPGDNKPEQYNLEDNEIWKLCEKLPEFEEIKSDLQKALANRNFPQEAVAELTYADMAYLICEQRQADSSDVERRQKRGKNEVDGVKMISSGRAKFFENYVNKHAEDLKKLLAAKGMPHQEIKTTLKTMRARKSVDIFDGHHNFAINDPDRFCKVTGEEWWKMNNHVVLMDKKAHTLLHSLENNVTYRGILLNEEESKTSHRTIFTDKKSGKKFYLAVRVKEGIDGLMGLHRETIYDKNYLSDNSFVNGQKIPNKKPEPKNKSEKAEQRKAEKEALSKTDNQQALQHAKERKTKLNEQKAAYTAPEKTENSSPPNPKKERFVTRKDYLGQRGKGGAQKFNNR